jgi:UDP-galactopyranose mutase
VCTSTLVTGIDVDGDRVTGVRYRTVPATDRGGQLCMLASGTEGTVDPFAGQRGPEERIGCDRIVNTAPLPALIELLGAAASAEAKAAARYLRFRALTIVGLRVKRTGALPAQSIYFQDKTFNRLSETRNYGGSEICAADETILLCDITCDLNDAIWNADADELGRICARELEQEGFMKLSELAESVVLRSTFGYPVYMVGYERAIDTLMTELMRFPGLVTGGRQGLYKYVDMDIASEMGLAMADFFASGRSKRDAIGTIPYEDRVFA